MSGGRKVTPINVDGSPNGWAFTGEAKGGNRITLVDDNGTPISISGGGGGTGTFPSAVAQFYKASVGAIPIVETDLLVSANNYINVSNGAFTAGLSNIVINTAGIYEVMFNANATHTNAVNTTLTIKVKVNGLVVRTYTHTLAGANGGSINIVSDTLLNLVPSDIVSVGVLASASNTNGYGAELTIKRVG